MYVYADNAATTAMSTVAIEAMTPYLNKVYGNPSSLHSIGQEAKEALEAARETVAQRGGQSGYYLRCPFWRTEKQKAHHLHRF